ncbi:unnamed protein product [Boreogadus saida]
MNRAEWCPSPPSVLLGPSILCGNSTGHRARDACELTLDPNTAHKLLSPSEDNRKVTWVGEDQSVGVYQDRPAGTLSFYRVSPDGGGSSDILTHIHTFLSTFTQDLYPGFRLMWSGCSVSLCEL